MATLELADPPVAQVQELVAVTDPSHSVEHQDFHQVALEATMDLDSPTLALPADGEVPNSVATSCLEGTASAPFMEVET